MKLVRTIGILVKMGNTKLVETMANKLSGVFNRHGNAYYCETHGLYEGGEFCPICKFSKHKNKTLNDFV